MQTYTIHIEGYWREKNRSGLPGYSGIFIVYSAVYNAENDTVGLVKILYVGENENVRESIVQNTSFAYWRSLLFPGQELCFAVAEMAASGRRAVRSALVYQLQPPANTEYKENQPEHDLEVLITGRTRLLPDRILLH